MATCSSPRRISRRLRSHALHINGPDGQRITAYTEAQGATLHVVIIHPDLSGFEHLTPDVAADGTFIVPIDKPGKWHIIIDAQPSWSVDTDRAGDERRRRGSGRGRQAPGAEGHGHGRRSRRSIRRGLSFTVDREGWIGGNRASSRISGNRRSLFAILHKDDLAYTPSRSRRRRHSATFTFDRHTVARHVPAVPAVRVSRARSPRWRSRWCSHEQSALTTASPPSTSI